MTFLRSLVFNILFYGWTAILAIVCLPSVFMGRSAVNAVLHLWLKGTFFFERAILNLDYKAVGQEHLPDGAFIVAAKHQSAWETFKLHMLFNDPAIVLKKGLIDIPLWGRYAKLMGMIPVDRSRGASALKHMLTHAKRVKGEGRPIVIFPQGTRVAVGDHKKYKQGIIKLYEELQLPIVPMALNSGAFWGKNSFIKKSGTITVEFLPIIPAGQNGKAVLKQLEQQIETISDRLYNDLKN